MAKDPYIVLGVGRQASQDDIRSAYRKLAKQYHPDRNPGDNEAEDKFKAASAAFEIIGDPEKRKRFDRGEIDADGNERAVYGQGSPFGGVDPAEAAERFARRARRGRPDPGGEAFSDIFSDFFGRGDPGPRAAPRAQKGRDVRTRLSVSFLDAARGTQKRVTLPEGSTVNVTIPEGLRDGQSLRLRGKGHPGVHGGPDGDLFVEVTVMPDPRFEAHGDDLTIEVDLPLRDAILGGKLDIPTLSGHATIKIPPNTSSGKSFRLKEKGLKKSQGVAHGDLYARVLVVLPKTPDPELEGFMTRWSPKDTEADANGMAATG